MKKPNIRNFLIPLAFLCSITASAKTISISIADTNEPSMLSTNVAPNYYQVDQYEDLKARCTNYITDIEMSERTALLKLHQGNVALATQILNDVLQKKSAEIGSGFNSMANPHTVVAIVQAAKIANVSLVEIEKFRNVLKNNTDILKLRMLEQLTKLVISAHRDLDSRFFYNVINQCHSYNCYNQSVYNLDFLPREYYQGVAELSRRFVQVYLSNKELMAADPIELMIASQTASSAAEILATSLYRRDFACPVKRLLDINIWINSELNVDPSYANLITVTEETRAQMQWALGMIYSDQCQFSTYQRR